MKSSKRNYRALFILDNRGQEDSIEKLIENIKGELQAVGAEVTATEDLGRKDFARVTDPAFPGAPYVQMDFSSEPTVPAQIKERLRLNRIVYRTFIQAL